MELAEFVMRGDAMLACLREVCDEQMADRVDAARSRLRGERLKILVVGEFSRGKSTFINALAGLPILPSKVNPTTATINVLRGGSPAEAVVEYLDGHGETLALPESGVNKFLDGLVTTANERAQSIRVVNIRIPGRLEALQADIVDTPGVNDLDQAREETTFGYLRQADAAVMLLDAQQPISESERAFLKEKVFGSDVNRILFVVNKIDEVDGEANVARIVAYVEGRLRECLGIQQPVVYAVSSKEALRARYRGEADSPRFQEFEQRLLAFAGAQATGGRLRVHLERIDSVLRDQRALLEVRAQRIGNEIADVERELHALDDVERALRERESRLDARLHDVGRSIAVAVGEHCRTEVAQFRTRMASNLKACASDDDVDDFRQALSGALRDLVSKIEAKANAASEAGRLELERDFQCLLGESGALMHHGGRSAAQLYQESRAPSVATISSPPGGDTAGLSDAAVGFGLGWVGASLFGPIGIAAAVVGTYVIGKSRRERQAAELARVEREQMIASLHESCDRLAERATATGEEVSNRESARLGDQIRERLRAQQAMLSASREGVRIARTHSKEQRSVLRDRAVAALAVVTRLQAGALSLSEDTKNAYH